MLKNPYIGKHFVKRKSLEPTEKYSEWCYRRHPNLIYAKDTFSQSKKLIDKEGLLFTSCPMYQQLLSKQFNDGSNDTSDANSLFSNNSMPKSTFEEIYNQVVEQQLKLEQKKKKHPLPTVEEIRKELIKIIAFHEHQEETYFSSVYPLPGCLNMNPNDQSSDEDENNKDQEGSTVGSNVCYNAGSSGSGSKKFDKKAHSYRKKQTIPLVPASNISFQPIRNKKGVISLEKVSKRKYKYKDPYPKTKRPKRGKTTKTKKTN